MIDLNVAIFIVSAFLLLTLVVGFYFSRKKTTFREYAVGNKNFATATLVATVLATAYGGGGLIRTVECVHDLGLWWVMFMLLGSFEYWFCSKLALRMGPFMHHLSVAETIGSVYGRYPRIISGVIFICYSIVVITGQINVMSKALIMCLGSTHLSVITVFSTLFVIFYSMFGGIRAVTYTDVLQFITFSIIIPLLGWFMFVKVDKPIPEIVSMLQSHPKFQFSNLFSFNTKLMSMVLLTLSCIVPLMPPSLMQRIYMSSSPIQAQKSFAYGTLFDIIIMVFITLVGVFVFASAPGLSITAVWDYIIDNIPYPFKGFLAISLLSMVMSTADSCLNTCSVMVSHDILQSIIGKKKIISDKNKIKIARWTTLVVGLLAMIIAFQCQDLLKLLYWSLDINKPIVAVPFLLAVFGFRGTARTALIGMATGLCTILAWNKWVAPSTEMNGAFIAILANGLAMMAAHYLLKQPKEAGWIKPDDTFKQIQQEKARISVERKEAIQNAWANKKNTLEKLQPSHVTLTCVGFYVIISNLLTYGIASITADHMAWLIAQFLVGACCIGYKPFVSYKRTSIPGWVVGLLWVVALAFCFPINVLWHWWHGTNLLVNLGLSLAHLSVTLLVLPLYLGVSLSILTLLMAIYLSSVYSIKPFVCVLSPSGVGLLLLACLGFCLFILGIFVYLKAKNNRYFAQITYLRGQEQIRSSQQVKASLYERAAVPANGGAAPKGDGSILGQAVGKVEETISFLDDHTPLFKQDFKSIINKFYDWVAYLNKRDKAKVHALLQPTKITLDKLIRKVELALAQEMKDPPRILVEQPNGAPSADMVCDIHQVVYALVKAVSRIGKIDGNNTPIVKVQLYPTYLQYKKADAIDEKSDPVCMDFKAIALVISQSTTDDKDLPKVKACYDETPAMDPTGKKDPPPSIDLEEDTISSMVHAHYGHLEVADGAQKPTMLLPTMLLVLPKDVTAVRDKMTAEFPTDALTIEAPVTPKEQADSMMALMKFHDHICKSSYKDDPIDLKIISGLILLLRENFRFKRHASGQLFYVRAVGIAEIVVEWVFHSPKVIYAALLYELVRHTCLPLSYIKEHYNLGVYAFVSNLIKIDKREDLNDSSLLYVKNKLKKAIKEDNVQLSVLFIKLAERLYDLRHASGYIHPQEVAHMVQETLAIDVQIAHTYLEPKIGKALKKAAKQAWKVCMSKEKKKEKETE